MSNLISAARTNYFRVKDPEAYRKALAGTSVEILCLNDGRGKMFALIDLSESGWCTHREEGDEDPNPYFITQQHLMDDEVAIFYEVGYDSKMRSVYGFAKAICSDPSKELTVDLSDIEGMVMRNWALVPRTW